MHSRARAYASWQGHFCLGAMSARGAQSLLNNTSTALVGGRPPPTMTEPQYRRTRTSSGRNSRNSSGVRAPGPPSSPTPRVQMHAPRGAGASAVRGGRRPRPTPQPPPLLPVRQRLRRIAPGAGVSKGVPGGGGGGRSTGDAVQPREGRPQRGHLLLPTPPNPPQAKRRVNRGPRRPPMKSSLGGRD